MGSKMKVFVVLLALCVAALALDAAGEGSAGAPNQVVNPPNWHGTWTANNRYGGHMYACPKGNRLYGVYSDAGFFIGSMEGRRVEGTWYEGGRGDRNDWQGSFRIDISENNQSFDGFYYRVTQDGYELRWHETRLGAPWPSNPTDEQCLVPGDEPLLGGFYNHPGQGNTPATYLFVKMNMIKSMVLLVALMVSLKDGVLIVPPDSTDTVMITMVKVVLTSYVLSLILTLKVSTGEDVLQDKTLQLLLKKILPELHTLHL